MTRRSIAGIACLLLAAGAFAQPATFTYRDPASGLVIDLPAAWERTDPDAVKKDMIASRERFGGPAAAEAVRQHTFVLFVMLARPYEGPARNRPMLSCVATDAPPGSRADQMGNILDRAIQSTFGRFERDAVISKPERFEISGREAYRATIEAKDASYRFVKLLQGDRMIDCTAAASGPHLETVERALASMKFE